MMKKRLGGQVQIVYDTKNTVLEEIALGILSRASGHNYKIAFVTQSPHSKLFTFLENLCISHKFPKHFERFHIETFNLRQNHIQRGILPQVEFQTIPYNKLLNILYTFDIVIFLNPNEIILNSPKLVDFLIQKQEETEIVLLLTQKPSKELKKIAQSVFSVESHKNNGLTSNSKVVLVSGSIFAELYSFGYLLKNFILKKNVKLIGFERGDQIYGEIKFFKGIKQFSKEYHLYGSFDFVHTGLPRITGPHFRSENSLGDLAEAKEALMLAETSLRKLTPVVIDNFEKIISFSLLEKKSEYSLLRNSSNEAIIPIKKHTEETKEYVNYCGYHISLFSEKSLDENDIFHKKGIHF